MKKSILGLVLALVYIVISVILIMQQGLFGESFIVIILGFPVSFLAALVLAPIAERGELSTAMQYIAVLTPVVINAIVLYFIGVGIDKLRAKKTGTTPPTTPMGSAS
jgi:predicted acyltransferase